MRLPIFLLIVLYTFPSQRSQAEQLKVLSFNILHGGDGGGQPLEQTVEVIRKAQPDIVGLQETHGHEVDGVRRDNGQRIADMLGWNYVDQGGRRGVLSRFPLGPTTNRKWGVEVEYAAGKTLLFFNAHFPASPYQPYQILKIPYGDAPFIDTEAQAIEWAKRSRGQHVERLLAEMQQALRHDQPIVLTGDFNEPSFQDWTERAAEAKLCPLKVAYPTTRRITDVGLQDAWRVAHPDEVAQPGWTWTPTTRPDDPQDRHDRIDFVFVRSQGITVSACQRVGEPGNSEITVQPWPSDHRAVLATIAVTQ